MKANEFVKKFGVGAAKNILHGMDDASEFTAHMPGDTWDKPTLIDAVGLRRLVESHELVESLVHIYKEIEIVREKASYCGCSECKSRLQAIFDVESCQ